MLNLSSELDPSVYIPTFCHKVALISLLANDHPSRTLRDKLECQQSGLSVDRFKQGAQRVKCLTVDSCALIAGRYSCTTDALHCLFIVYSMLVTSHWWKGHWSTYLLAVSLLMPIGYERAFYWIWWQKKVNKKRNICFWGSKCQTKLPAETFKPEKRKRERRWRRKGEEKGETNLSLKPLLNQST